MGMPERSVTGRPLVPFSIGGPQKGIMGDSEQGVDRKPLSLCSILVSGPRLWQEVRTPFLKSTLTPKSQGASSALSGRWGEFRGHGSDDLSSPHLLLSALLYLWLVLTELRNSPVSKPKGEDGGERDREHCSPCEADVTIPILSLREWRLRVPK